MKLLFVMLLLLISLISLIISIDLLAGKPLRGEISRSINPFYVMEPMEYVVILLFFLTLGINLFHYFRKKKQNSS